MKHKSFWFWATLWFLGGSAMPFLAPQVHAAEIQATLIYASSDPASLDARLDPIEYKLRKLFRFETYQLMDQLVQPLNARSQTVFRFPEEIEVELESGKGSDDQFSATIRWSRKGEALMSTGVRLRRGQPTVLGGPSYRNGSLILNIELR